MNAGQSRLLDRVRAGGLWPLALVSLIGCLDLIANAGSRSTTEIGFLDEPAHLATGILVVLVLIAALRAPPSATCLLAALVASMAIDVDHIPQYLGWNGLTEGAPRPYTHSLATVVVLCAAALPARGRLRDVALGAALGVCAHLLRDLATASGVALLWSLDSSGARIPYWCYVVALALMALFAIVRLTLPRTGHPPPRPGSEHQRRLSAPIGP